MTAPQLLFPTESRARIGDVSLPNETISMTRQSSSPVPESLRITEPVMQCGFLVDGAIRSWNGAMHEVVSPISLSEKPPVVVGQYPLLTREEGLHAIDAASNAWGRGLGEWPSFSFEERIERCERFLARMVEKRSEVVKLLVWEIAKTVPDAEKEFDRTVDYMRETIRDLRAMLAEGATPRTLGGTEAVTSRAPVGVVLCMGPFNYPLNETLTTLLPALLMGNTTVMKAPKLGVLLFSPLLEAFQECFPAGAVNIIYGDGREVITPIIESGKVDGLAFIGSSGVAASLIRQHPAPHRLHTILGLGAKNPAIILPDADLDSVVEECITGALSYNGQRCTALKLLFVHESIADEFSKRFASAVERLKCGLPWESGVKITPLCEPGKTGWMDDYVTDAVAHGARVVNEGGGQSNGTLFTPAVLYPVTREMKICQEEQFGPVVPIVPFRDVSAVMKHIAESPYGQQASLFTGDEEGTRSIAETLLRLTGGRVNINTQCQRGPDQLPFGGRKDSALGELSIREALEAFSLPTVLARRAEKAV